MNRQQFIERPTAAVAAMSAAAPGPAQTRKTAAGSFQAGYAEQDITPEIGMEQPGGYSKVFHRSLHDPCKARAGVFDDGSGRVALVGLDALIVPRALVLAARRRIQQRCGIAAESVMIGASWSIRTERNPAHSIRRSRSARAAKS
jgi:hypothetical protein